MSDNDVGQQDVDVETSTEDATTDSAGKSGDQPEATTQANAAEAPAKTETPAADSKTQTVATTSEVTPAPDADKAKATQDGALFDLNKIGILNDLNVVVSIEIGRAKIKIRDLLNLTKNSIIELDKLAGEPVDIYVNGKLISTGNIITANGKYCVRLTSINEANQAGVQADGK